MCWEFFFVALYYFVNNRFEPNYSFIKSNSKIIYELIVDDVIINGVYEFKDLVVFESISK